MEVSFGLAFSEKGAERIEVAWRFDELYTQAMLPDYLKKGEKQLSAKAVRQLHDDVFRFLGEFHYYTDIAVNGAPLLPVKAEGFTARVDRGVLVFAFTVPLAKPVAAGTLELLGFDPEYFVEYTLAGPIEARGKPFRHTCRTKRFQRDTDITGPIGVAGLSCSIG